jgi:hypothetical protein
MAHSLGGGRMFNEHIRKTQKDRDLPHHRTFLNKNRVIDERSHELRSSYHDGLSLEEMSNADAVAKVRHPFCEVSSDLTKAII